MYKHEFIGSLSWLLKNSINLFLRLHTEIIWESGFFLFKYQCQAPLQTK